ncbi:MAG: DegV family protein [Eubacteriales bacterium]|jgi:DegV family protein with EDD domain
MSKIILVAESGSDMSPELAAKYGVYIVPMHVTFGEDTLDDGSFDPQKVVDYYNKTGKAPKTSGTNVAEFEAVFDEIHEKYPDAQILYLAYSAVTTVSFSSGKTAAEGRDYVTCVDTKMVSAGQSAVVVRVAQMLQEHPEWDIARAKKEAERISAGTHFVFMPQNLDFLRAGGRCTNAAALIGNILHIVPLIDIVDGYLVAVKKYRGSFKRTIRKMIGDYVEKYRLEKDQPLYVITAPGFKDEYRNVIVERTKELGYKTIEWLKTGGVITTHGGVGAFGVAGFEDGV